MKKIKTEELGKLWIESQYQKAAQKNPHLQQFPILSFASTYISSYCSFFTNSNVTQSHSNKQHEVTHIAQPERTLSALGKHTTIARGF